MSAGSHSPALSRSARFAGASTGGTTDGLSLSVLVEAAKIAALSVCATALPSRPAVAGAAALMDAANGADRGRTVGGAAVPGTDVSTVGGSAGASTAGA